jgi:erythromycin esterase-like protein
VTWPSSNLYRHLVSSARAAAQPFHATRSDMNGLSHGLESAPIVLFGEASHGTQNFYHLRAGITKHLVEHHGLTAVAVEADWPDAYRANRFVRGESADLDANAALSGFERFPSWLWRNTEVLSFIRWLREWNDAHPTRKVGFYGLDLYSLNTSIRSVIAYLDRVDPEAARRARVPQHGIEPRRCQRHGRCQPRQCSQCERGVPELGRRPVCGRLQTIDVLHTGTAGP